jgi:hypothetical protein
MTAPLFTLKQSGMIGQEIISPRGKVVAWTVDPLIGNVLCRFLNEVLANDNFAMNRHDEEDME